jgi:hypothetical protein
MIKGKLAADDVFVKVQTMRLAILLVTCLFLALCFTDTADAEMMEKGAGKSKTILK